MAETASRKLSSKTAGSGLARSIRSAAQVCHNRPSGHGSSSMHADAAAAARLHPVTQADSSTPALRCRGLVKRLRRHGGGRRPRPRGRPRRMLRDARPERRRQDHDRRDLRRPEGRRRRRHRGPGRSLARRRAIPAAAPRHPASGDEVSGEAAGPRGRHALSKLLSARAWRGRGAASRGTRGEGAPRTCGRSPADRSSACRSAARWSAIPSCCFSTSPPRASIRSRAARRGRSSKGLKARGRSVLLTTHYMEEAARLCDRVAIVDHGKVIASRHARRS